MVGDGSGVRDRLAVALDTDDLESAVSLARAVAPWFGVGKVGLELFGAAGPDAVRAVADCGLAVFLDLKLHDIPTTVERAARAVARLGPAYVTLHTLGGVEMLRAGVEGLAAGAPAGSTQVIRALGVTVLTSEASTDDELARRVDRAVTAGCPGVVTAARNVTLVKSLAPSLTVVTPGIRPAGTDVHDHADPATPEIALSSGSDLLVIGRAVTGATDPVAAARELAEGLAALPVRG